MQHLIKVDVFASKALLNWNVIFDCKKQMAFYFPKKNHSNIVNKNIDT